MNNLPHAVSLPGLYIHIPFCLSRCRYCGFVSTADFQSSDLNRYVKCLEMEMRYYSSEWPAFGSVYLGGGTPSLLDACHLESIFAGLESHFSILPDAEVTLEANPGDIHPDRVAWWKRYGVNRISLGVQALDDSTLIFLGRRHDAKTAVSAIKLIASARLSLSIDLIYGYPGHTRHDWETTLLKALKYRPEHLSCYQMTIEPETWMAHQVKSGGLTALNADDEADLFETTHAILTTNDYEHYEVSSFALKPGHVAVHNTKYWFRTPYLGLGTATHSFDGNRRWANSRNINGYCQDLEDGALPVETSEIIGSNERLQETIFLGLRTRWGVLRDELPGSVFTNARFRQMVESGYLEETAERIRPTASGLAIADALAAELIALSDHSV